MRIGLPQGLYYYKYSVFIEEFLRRLYATVIISPKTNKNILNDGVKSCVDEACLPIKIFHGHVSYLKDKCDLIIIPRIMEVKTHEYICPKFCGLPEMIINSIEGLPKVTTLPLYLSDNKKLYKWCEVIGRMTGAGNTAIKKAFLAAYNAYKRKQRGVNDTGYSYKVALLGHPYNIYDEYVNMNIIKKLNALDVGVITEEFVNDENKKKIQQSLLKKPFWTCMIKDLGAGAYLTKNNLVDGIIFLSSFQCGIDSVAADLLREFIGISPMLVLKLDEHTGEAGIDTRIEAFTDMLKRRQLVDSYISAHG